MRQIQHYLEDTYHFNAISDVIAHGADEWGQWIALRENIFHPQGGGQPADRGWVNDIPVTVRKQESGLVALYPVSPFSLSGETKVISVLSKDDRTHHAALHTAGHLLNWEMRRFGWMAIRGHHFPGESRVEFTASDSSAVQPDRLQPEEIEEIIRTRLCNGASITTWYEDGIRLCLIEGTEPMPCAGTHTDNLSKISMFSIKAIKFKKGTLRISYDAEHIALKDTHV
ncbi:alanyl-tRNA synthetase [Xenorhabdus szentirmaii]|uniref:Threonyl/alanyl tRNA synthetase SAD domain-containing protein n=2 Tax=Xenorhabdus szentirmaii TaxID=290112 RepID=W1IUH0_9GAMM|nr:MULTISPECIES: alanyl-tRNA synthetase [Xenorhabdus]MBD2781885.1 hypothetical protein [Xenorhabdus sp. 38]MBD2792132.1 hypothetical protein [Xenorhabdus sp. CUL]MBD2801981.1 hypothetical protein [Xenorhabdus sp. M]MBD2821900.1 hypothetical protein [Xenorhabdus sp. 42]MBD2825552.1 hypothetical protein [Xenorhabdus sp. 5]